MSIITKYLDKKPRFDFMKYYKLGFIFSLAMIVVAGLSLHFKGLRYGIDFTGGILIEVQAKETINIEKLRHKIDATGIRAEIQSIGETGDEASIRVFDEGNSQNAKKIQEVLGVDYEIRKNEMVGPKVGEELKSKSLLAALLAVLAIATYIWFRFEWPFATCAFISLVHDAFVTIGFYALIGESFDLTVVAALLTLIGYSINDTVVSYDRVRENVRKHKKLEPSEVLNLSLNETLGRTILTGISTLLALVSILIFGGEGLRGFSITLAWGVIIGTFSSVYIAVPLLKYFNIKKLNEE